MYYSTTYLSPVGKITLLCDADNLIGLWMEREKHHGNTVPGTINIKHDHPIFVATKDWLDRYFAREKPSASELPLATRGSEFQQGVWQILREIPYGKVITYGEIAKIMAAKMGRDKMSSQAVGGAVGNNPISIIIPCHRVVGSNGNLTGFSAGIKIKIKLLELEGVDMSRLFVPKKGTAL